MPYTDPKTRDSLTPFLGGNMRILALISLLAFSRQAYACTWEVVVTNRMTREIRYFKPTASDPAQFEAKDQKTGTEAHCSASVTQESDPASYERLEKLRTKCTYRGSNLFSTTASAVVNVRGGENKSSLLYLFGTDPNTPTFELRGLCK